MATLSSDGLTEMLRDWSKGDAQALDRLVPLVYDELRRLARAHLRRERFDNTLQPTALVHEAYLRLADRCEVQCSSRAHFFGIAARLMRQILVEHARSRNALKRGGVATRVTLSEAAAFFDERSLDLFALDDALDALEQMDPQKARIVELRFFSGMTVEETAEALGVSTATITRQWRLARAWLYRRVRKT